MVAGVTHGEARIRLSVGPNGQLTDALVIASTHREFGEEALRVVKDWTFEPTQVNGQPVAVVGDIIFEFNVNGPIAIEKRLPSARTADEEMTDWGYRAEGTKRLDAIPTPKHIVPPVYPKDWAARGIIGRATIEFYIDETGAARVPVATASAHPLLAAAAVAAVAQWRFEPPRCGGKAVLVRAEQDFNFQPESDTPTTAAK